MSSEKLLKDCSLPDDLQILTPKEGPLPENMKPFQDEHVLRHGYNLRVFSEALPAYVFNAPPARHSNDISQNIKKHEETPTTPKGDSPQYQLELDSIIEHTPNVPTTLEEVEMDLGVAISRTLIEKESVEETEKLTSSKTKKKLKKKNKESVDTDCGQSAKKNKKEKGKKLKRKLDTSDCDIEQIDSIHTGAKKSFCHDNDSASADTVQQTHVTECISLEPDITPAKVVANDTVSELPNKKMRRKLKKLKAREMSRLAGFKTTEMDNFAQKDLNENQDILGNEVEHKLLEIELLKPSADSVNLIKKKKKKQKKEAKMVNMSSPNLDESIQKSKKRKLKTNISENPDISGSPKICKTSVLVQGTNEAKNDKVQAKKKKKQKTNNK